MLEETIARVPPRVPIEFAISQLINPWMISERRTEFPDYRIQIQVTPEEHTWPVLIEDLNERIEFHKSLACRIKLEPSEMMIADDVKAFLCQELPRPTAEIIFERLEDLENAIKATFPGLVSITLDLFVDPEAAGEKGIQVNILLKESPDVAFSQYDEYVETLIEQFPFEFSEWFFTNLNFV